MNKLDVDKVNVGDIMAFTNFVRVKAKSYNSLELKVEDLDHDNKEIKVTGRDMIENSYSADQYNETRKVSRSDMIYVLITSFNKPFSASFIKEDDSERIIRGRYIKNEELYGRSVVEDLEINDTNPANRIRQVDHRTLQWLVVDNIKYAVK